MKLRTLAAALAGLLALTLAPATTATAAQAGASPRAAVVPGSGWYLTQVSSRTEDRLVLVSPTGEQTPLYQRAVSRAYGGFSLLDWSADGHTALLVYQRKRRSVLVRVDATTGAVLELPMPLLNSAILDPSGTGVLVTAFPGRRSNQLVLDRVDWAGTRTTLRRGVNGVVMAGHSGTVLVEAPSGRKQYLLSTADGSVLHAFRVQGYCSPVRWWDGSQVLETCGQDGDLYTVDPATGAASKLTDVHGRGDYGHLDARSVGSQLYVQVAGACGYTYVARVGPRRTKPLKVPGATGNVLMVDAVGTDLVLEHTSGCDGGNVRSLLARFHTTDGTETPLVTLGRRTYFGRVMVFGEVRASAY